MLTCCQQFQLRAQILDPSRSAGQCVGHDDPSSFAHEMHRQAPGGDEDNFVEEVSFKCVCVQCGCANDAES